MLEIFENLAEDPLVVSMHELEGLHAGGRSVCARSMDRRKRLPVSVFCTQSLTRWRRLHASRLGKTRREIVPVRKHILKKPQTRGPRTSCGYNMFVSEQNKIYPCAAATLKKVVDEMLPDGKQWVREVYQGCREATEPEALGNCVVRQTQPPLDLDKLRRHRNADRTCFQAHPGLCISDPNATAICSFHNSLKKAMQTFKLNPATSCGEALFLFTGYRRKADADRAQRLVRDHAVDSVSGDDFEMVFLTDEPERRKQLKVYTRCHCRVDDQRRFHFGSHAGLVQTDEQTLDERVGHGFSKLLRDRCKYWLCFMLAYADVEEEFHVVKVRICL